MAKLDEFTTRNRPHLSIDVFRQSTSFSPPRRSFKHKPSRDDYGAHAKALLDQLAKALGEPPAPSTDQRLSVTGLQRGVIVEVSTAPPAGARAKAAKVPAKLEMPAQDIVLLRTERRDDRTEAGFLFIPDSARDALRKRIADYGRDPGNAQRPDVDRFEAVETIAAAPARTLVVGDVDLTAPDNRWWELWVHAGADRAASVAAHARSAKLDVHPDRLVFPETTVVFVHAPAVALLAFADRVPGAITEIRPATGTIEPFLDRDVEGSDQHAWVAEFADRVMPAPDDAPVVCALDTGVAAAHPLLRPGLKGAWAYDAAWGTDDHALSNGHGTEMAGLILYGDLEPHLNSAASVTLAHGVESMKLLPPGGFPPTEPPSYGVVTQGSVALVEAARPNALRSFCLAVSTGDFSPERPSSWSGALDQIAAGSMPGDYEEGVSAAHRPKRLVLVATGNATGEMLNEVLQPQPLEDPSQSWNALTIGGFTRKDQTPTPPPKLTPVVPANHRSPFSRGSQTLPDDLTPIKPEVLFEAGNMLRDDAGFCGGHEAVSLLATGSKVITAPLAPFWATSAAAGVAGNFVGRLQASLPDRWPETHRALTVDSASWPQPIRKLFIGDGIGWTAGTKAERQRIVREMGYGVPDIERAVLSARNEVTLIAEAEIQPFTAGASKSNPVFNECHFYKLPWPKSALEQLENEVVMMKVTLSYFVEPNISGKAATRPDTYRSFGLRFAMKKRNENYRKFHSRISSAQEKDDSAPDTEPDRWLLGSKAVQAGSLHCDLWRGRAIELVGHDAIAVFPVGGWWKSHVGQRRFEDRGRYSLVISLSAPGHAVDLHAEVASLVEAAENKIRVAV